MLLLCCYAAQLGRYMVRKDMEYHGAEPTAPCARMRAKDLTRRTDHASWTAPRKVKGACTVAAAAAAGSADDDDVAAGESAALLLRRGSCAKHRTSAAATRDTTAIE